MMNNTVVLFFRDDLGDNRIQAKIRGFGDIRVKDFIGIILQNPNYDPDHDFPGQVLDPIGLEVEGIREYVVNYLGDYLSWIAEFNQDMEIFVDRTDLDAIGLFQNMIETSNCKWGDPKSKTKFLNLVKLDTPRCKSSTEERVDMIFQKILDNDFTKIKFTTL